MGIGIGASITHFSAGTTISSTNVNNDFDSLNSNGVSNDNGNISTDGSGTMTLVGLIAQVINSNPPAVTVNGTTNGTAQLYEVFQGTFKLCILAMNGYQNNSGTEQTISLPTPFTAKGFCISGAMKQLTPDHSGSALTNSVRQVTGLAAGGGSTNVQNFAASEGLASITAPFDAIGMGTGEATTATDIAIFFGI